MKPHASWMAASLAAAALAGCAGTSGPIRAFENWRQAILDEDFETFYRLMSPTLKSDWVFRIFKPVDERGALAPLAQKYARRLDRELLPDFEIWLGHNKRDYDISLLITPMPENLLESAWTRAIIREDFFDKIRHLKLEFSMVRVTTGGEDLQQEDNQVTLIVRNRSGASEFYVMAHEDGRWRVHYHRSGPR